MRKGYFVPMITLLLLLSACGGGAQVHNDTDTLRARYQQMRGCEMEASVSCTQYGGLWEAVLTCRYNPDGECVVEVIAPDTIAGTSVIFDGGTRYLSADGKRINAGAVSSEGVSPSDALPRLIDALRDGWLLEENVEDRDGERCTRLTVDQTGEKGGKLFSTIWLRQSDGIPLRGEIAVDGETVLTVEFTAFTFSDIMKEEEHSP